MKYPIIKMFFDADLIPCVFTSDVLQAFPCIEYLSINYTKNEKSREFVSFHWDIGNHNVMALDDLLKFVSLYEKICNKLQVDELNVEDCDLTMIAECSVCGELLMPDDECYSDKDTGEPLCASHSVFDEETNNYKKNGNS